MNHTPDVRMWFDRIGQRSLIIAGVGAALLVLGALTSLRQFFQSYLYGYIIWVALALGCLGILLLHHLVSGHWGNVIQRIVESGARTMGLMAVLFIPIVFGMTSLYPWSDHTYVEGSHIVHSKAPYLNVPFFLVRSVVYFALWAGAAYWLSKKSVQQDENGDPSLTRRMKLFSGPGMVLFILTATFASIDWIMSLEPEWYSTIYGIMIIVGAVLTTLAFSILVLSKLAHHEPLADVLTTRHYHHLGNLLMAFTILWAYMSFSQFLIIWSGNLPEDNFWYIRRLGTGWSAVAVLLLVGHFFVPFLVLLSRQRKRHLENLVKVAVLILVMRFVDLFWLIVPAFSHETFRFHWMDAAAPLFVGGLWMTVFIKHLRKAPLLPLHDPRFTEGGGGH